MIDAHAERVVVHLDDGERQRCKHLARLVLASEHGSEAEISVLRARCRARFYEWGDLFLKVVELVRVHQGNRKQLARLAELRADLRAFVADDARPDDDDQASLNLEEQEKCE